MNDPAAQMMSQHQPPPQQMMNQSQPPMLMNQPPTLPPHPPSQMMNRSYGMWAAPPLMPQLSMDQMKFQQHPNPNLKAPLGGGGYGSGKLKQQQQGSKPLGPRNNWKGKGKRVTDGRRKDNLNMALAGGSSGGGLGGSGSGNAYQPPTLNELKNQNRMKAKRFFSKKKYNPHYHTHFNNNNNGGLNMGKFAPRNTSSFLIRAKKSGGIAELVSPYPVTPAVLPTPMFSPSREVLVDMAKEEWGVDGYGSMKGLIRLRSPGREDEGDDDDDGESSDSDVEDHVEVERRLDHDLSRFEMVYPNNAGGMDYHNVLENRVDDQDTHIAQLEDENLILKERLFLMERELGELRRRMKHLERHNHGECEDLHGEEPENESDSETESHEESRQMGFNHEEFVEENTDHRDAITGEESEDAFAVSKLNYENVIQKDGHAAKMMDETLGKDVAARVKVNIESGKAGTTDKGVENEADQSFGTFIELPSKKDTNTVEMIPGEREEFICNDVFANKFDQASELMDETAGKDTPIKEDTEIENGREKTQEQWGSAKDAGSDMLATGSEGKDKADNDAITCNEA